MLKERQQVFAGLFVAADMAVLGCAWMASYALRFVLPPIPVTKGTPPLESYLALLPVIWAIWGAVLRAGQLYDPMRGRASAVERRRVVRSSSLAMLVFTAVCFLLFEKAFSLSRLMLLYFWGLATAGLVVERALVREMLRALRRRGYNQRHVLIVGDGDLARGVADRMAKHRELGLKVRGFLTDDPAMVGTPVANRPILGLWDDVSLVAAAEGVDQVVIALPLEGLPRLGGLLARLDTAIVDVKVVPDIERFVSLRSGIEDFGGLPVISLRTMPLSGWGRVSKRAMDVAVATAALVLLAPLFGLIALLVRTTSPGPVFFSQERMGLDGRVFRVWKFRTMRADAEASTGPVWAVADDPRRTRLGAFLRRTSLDELPQLLNVLRGEMSLVGPRPERPVFIEEFRRLVPRYMMRHMVQAGMTGWAQVHGWRGNTPIEKRIQYDLYYIENWSLLLDLKIIFLTFVRGFVDRNAY